MTSVIAFALVLEIIWRGILKKENITDLHVILSLEDTMEFTELENKKFLF